MSEFVFVYGTLRTGGSNDWRMAAARSLGRATVNGVLVAIDWYPGLVLDPSGAEVIGELFEVDGETLQELDAFEGLGEHADEHPGEYHRVRATVITEGGAREAWIYEWLKEIKSSQVVVSGDWFDVSA